MSTLFQNPLFCISALLISTLAVTYSLPARRIEAIRLIILTVSLIALFLGLVACLSFDKGVTGFQFLSTLNVIEQYNLSFVLGADGFSMIFLLLTLFIFPVLFLAA